MADEKPGTFREGLKDGWFTELSSMWPGQGLSLKVDEILFEGKSDFQDVAVFQSGSVYGRVLVLDGVIQCTEYDECSYQEMITHLPLCSLKHEPKRVLVVGGGDGGVVREVSRHPYVEQIEMAEIDKMVPEMGKRFFPKMAVGFDDPRTTLHITDGLKYVQDAEEGTYDAIIVDSSDPVGPAQVLFEKPFFENMHRALKPGGVICTQAESLWLHLGIIQALAKMCKEVFVGGSVQYAFTTIPTYPSGQIGFMICTKADPDKDCSVAQRPPPEAAAGSPLAPLRYYSEAVHRAAFALPKFAEDALKESLG